jgi:hypothetical protein
LLAYSFPPSWGEILHAKILSKVVFPAPLAPIIVVVLPALKIPLIPLRIYFYLNFDLHGILDFFSLSLT